MSTGYTAKIHDGKNQSFEDFVLTCARAFGACIMQRDDSMEVKPKLQIPSDYHFKELSRARKELGKFNNTPKKEFRAEFDKYVEKTRKYNQKAISDKEQLKKRYESMLEKVEKWNCPKDHEGLKNFMSQQLKDSIQFDCDGDYYDKSDKELNKLTFNEWYNVKKEMLKRDIEYHTKGNADEIKMTNERNKWITDLYKSLGIK